MNTPKHSNRLVHETSPYLLQHAHNPVDWYPWGGEALSRARRENKLILLSIGYSACHWCHVMEHESFENEAIAELMNRDFVNIKVDREERPDLDDIYMAATVAMNQGQGGWPMTVFLTPDLQPIFAGTYFPPDDRSGRPGFGSLLQRITQAWEGDRDELVKSASLLTARLRQEKEGAASPMAVGEEELRAALGQYVQDFDAKHGGFGSAPKFPPSAALQLLLRLHRRFDDEQALEMVRKTLDAMARGGLYDQVGGGFARYSTDARWLVPHFEKMLYDNALLVSAYLDGYQVTGSDLYRRIVTETLDYVRREMTSEGGGIYSATDADSEGVEGKFFVWTPEQIAEILDEDEARYFNSFYDIRPGGNWEGSSIPNTPRPLEEVAAEFSKTPEEFRGILDTAREEVYQARLLRVAPGLDDKILTAWNGMMIVALAQAYNVLGERGYLEAAQRAADFILDTLRRDDGGLFRTCRAGKARLDAYLEDYAWMTEALLTLYEVSGDVKRLAQATELAERLLSDFLDGENGGFFNTAHGHEKLILRYRDGTDGATPSGNAVAASALARLSFHSDRADVRTSKFRQAAMGAIKAHGRLMTRFPRAFAKSLSVVDFLLEGPVELAFVGKAEGDDLEALRREVARHYVPNRIQAISSGAPADTALPPLLHGKLPVDGKAALYICRDFTCRAPVTEVSAVAEALGAARSEIAATSLAIRLPGRATAEGTRRYAARYGATRGDHGFVSLGTTDLQVSRLGFGSYRVGDTDDGHRDALHHALASGINLVDTSTNYTDGSSERLIGSVLRQRVDAGQLQRDEVVVVSKIGYVQGKNFELARQREADGRGFPEMVKIDNGPPEGRYGLWHCLHPDYLEDQLGRSLDRLELETLDVCLLHNPEYFLAYEVRRGESLDKAREEFYRRLEEAFRYFEGEVRSGRLGAYGVSSNTVGAPIVAGDATSLSRMLDAARAAGGDDHHFRVLQLPLNLFEAGPLLEFNTGDPAATALGLARERNIAVLVNRPLNAFTEGGLLRLSEVDSSGDPVDFEAQVQRLADLEEKFRQNIASRLRPEGSDASADGVSTDGASVESDPANAFRWADELPAVQARLRGLDQWSQVATQIAYMVNRTAAMFDQNLSGELEQHWDAFKGQYFPVLNGLLGEMRRRLAIQAKARSVAIAGAIEPLFPAERRDASLSQKALWTAASTPGVTVVLSGMRRVEYVDDAVVVLGWSSLSSVDGIYQAVGGIELPE